MAAVVVFLLATAGSVLGLIIAVLTIREKLWPKAPTPHPLEATLRDIALAIRQSP